MVPVLGWNESLFKSFFICYIFRQGVTLHSTWFVNSAAHMIGDKPYDPTINPVENEFVSMFTLGEGYHNFHHAFPYDYRAADFGVLNTNKLFLDAMDGLGFAHDLKVASKKVIQEKQTLHNLL